MKTNTSMEFNTSLADLPEQQLLQRFADLVGQDRHNTAQLLAHIGEIDEHRLWAKHACPSMFAFCMERFHMSESMTAKRIWAARTARRFPVILPMVARGELHLSAINQLGKHLTEDNHRSLLGRAKHKSSREIDVLLAELAPRPDVPSRVRALPRLARGVAAAETLPANAQEDRGPDEQRGPDGQCVPNGVLNCLPAAAKPFPVHKQVVALAPRRFKIEITVDQRTHDQLRSLQDLLGHRSPSADPAMIVSRAIELLLDDTLKKKAAVAKASGTGAVVTRAARAGVEPSTKLTRAIPAAIRREVRKRDVGRCTFVDQQGRRCRATRCIEYHHVIPYGKGGRHEAENIATLPGPQPVSGRAGLRTNFHAEQASRRGSTLVHAGQASRLPTFRAECAAGPVIDGVSHLANAFRATRIMPEPAPRPSSAAG